MINKERSLKKYIDSVDRGILRFMNSANRSLTGNQIAKKVNLSPPAIKPRLVNLQNMGIIKPQMTGANRIWDNPRSLKRKIIAPSMVKWGLDLKKK